MLGIAHGRPGKSPTNDGSDVNMNIKHEKLLACLGSLILCAVFADSTGSAGGTKPMDQEATKLQPAVETLKTAI